MGKNSMWSWLCLWLLCAPLVWAQSPTPLGGTQTYFVYFTDKLQTPYSLDRPEAFLSERAIQRRQRQHIDLTLRDLPVTPAYVAALRNAGAEVRYTSRWFNGAVIEASDSVLTVIQKLHFVANDVRLTLSLPAEGPRLKSGITALADETEAFYGASASQVTMLGAEHMHEQGWRGEGMQVAVLDAGFSNADALAAFAHLYDQNPENGEVLGTYDFVSRTPQLYRSSSHGTQVLSCLAAYLPGVTVGTAYRAQYYLFRTEDTSGERTIEEFNWLAAAERADSLGVDVINSSLGYSQFNDPAMSYVPAQMDGNTAFVTRAADMAASVGMLVVVSAGNEGSDVSWNGKITAPGDADSVLTVGAVWSDSSYASFSSRGPSADGRLKPDVVAQGVQAVVVQPSGAVVAGNGTSFAAPILCGLAVGVWQAFPDLTPAEVIQVLHQAGSQATHPDSLLGYGIPNFGRAATLAEQLLRQKTAGNVAIYPTVVEEGPVKLGLSRELWEHAFEVRAYDALGRLVHQEKVARATAEQELRFPVATLPPGVYLIRVWDAQQTYTFKVVRL
ncbi:Por secretion system C-terminal sorting domain-containing protein [Catalinimonas alkaloidigena]|uniref:Por secretion system C-terminal sorting domain-containing protein n=1 Tax=Catalinimonas alkaloidigena TaxID=1075417 RepID=A0A1G9K4F2_9BACT|nr:S8 family peptidase [Catalinimonas alkaloidigena]SDL44628.1 Por secretion system C-terminal sorting domain-containing protein [Catalinimonas alkaloidigena]